MKGTETKFMVVPKGSFTIASLGEFLNTFYRTDGEEAHFFVGNNNVPKDGFFIPHGVITKIKRNNPEWRQHFEFFSQKGGGKINPHNIPHKKRSSGVKKVAENLKKIIANKKSSK